MPTGRRTRPERNNPNSTSRGVRVANGRDAGPPGDGLSGDTAAPCLPTVGTTSGRGTGTPCARRPAGSRRRRRRRRAPAGVRRRRSPSSSCTHVLGREPRGSRGRPAALRTLVDQRSRPQKPGVRGSRPAARGRHRPARSRGLRREPEKRRWAAYLGGPAGRRGRRHDCPAKAPGGGGINDPLPGRDCPVREGPTHAVRPGREAQGRGCSRSNCPDQRTVATNRSEHRATLADAPSAPEKPGPPSPHPRL